MTTREIPPRALAQPTQLRSHVATDRWIVAALTVLAFALRAPNLGRAYWIDEGITIGIASHPLRQLPQLLRQDGSPPLFYVLLHLWMRAFGESEVATHFLPLTVSLLAIPLGYWAASDLFNRQAGLAAAALLATNPFLGWYSTETRMYPLLICLAVVGITLAWRAVRDRRARDAVGAVLVYVALLYTHDWAIYLTAVTAGVLFMMALVARDRRLASQVAIAGGVTIALWLPWLPTFIDQAHNTAAPWAVQPRIGDFFADPSSALGGTLGFVVVPLLAFGVYWNRRGRPPADGRLAGLLGAIGVLTALAGWLGAQIEPSWTVRYLAVIVGPLLLAAAGALACNPRGWTVIVAVCTLLAGWSAIGSLLPNANAEYAKSNVAAVARAVAPQLRAGDVVVVTQTEQVAVLAHYLPPGLVYVTPTGRVPDPLVVDWRNLVARLQQADPCLTVASTVDALPAGSDVLLVDPAAELGASGTAWSKAVNGQVVMVDTVLANDPALTPIGKFSPALRPKPFSPVRAILYRRNASLGAC